MRGSNFQNAFSKLAWISLLEQCWGSENLRPLHKISFSKKDKRHEDMLLMCSSMSMSLVINRESFLVWHFIISWNWVLCSDRSILIVTTHLKAEQVSRKSRRLLVRSFSCLIWDNLPFNSSSTISLSKLEEDFFHLLDLVASTFAKVGITSKFWQSRKKSMAPSHLVSRILHFSKRLKRCS